MALKKRGFRIYLETNGTLPDALLQIKEEIDIIAMDVKLPTSTKRRGLWSEHRRFLKLSKDKDVFVKIIVTHKTGIEDIRRAVDIVKETDCEIPLCIQPAFSRNGIKQMVSGKILMKFQEIALKNLKDVRVIPQIHRVLKIK